MYWILKKILIWFVLFINIISLFSCTSSNDVSVDHVNEYAWGRDKRCVFNDTFYAQYRNGIVHYCELPLLSEMNEYALPLCFDPLCDHVASDCMAYLDGYSASICVNENNGSLYLYYTMSIFDEEDEEIYVIEQKNISDDETERLITESDIIQRFMLIDTGIFYELTCGYEQKICYYSFEEKTITPISSDGKYYYLIGYENNCIYYNDSESIVYKVNLFENNGQQQIMKGILPYGYYVYNGNLLYPGNNANKSVDGIVFNEVTLCSTSLSEPNGKTGNVIAYDVCCYGNVGAEIFNNKLYYISNNPEYVGTKKEYYEDGSEEEYVVFNEHKGQLWEYDLITGEENLVFNDIGLNIRTILYASDSYIIFKSTAEGYKNIEKYNPYTSIYSFDRNNGVLSELLYYGRADYD